MSERNTKLIRNYAAAVFSNPESGKARRNLFESTKKRWKKLSHKEKAGWRRAMEFDIREVSR